eukprot:symbB.v1.2.007518.t1/scaffold462.1/size201456/8
MNDSKDEVGNNAPFNSEAIEVMPDIKVQPRRPVEEASLSPAEKPEKAEKERRFTLFPTEKKPKDKLDISGAKEFMQIHFALRKFYFDLLYPPGVNGRRRAMLRLGALWFQSLGARGAPYRLWSCLAPPLVVVGLPVGDPMHKHPALGLQVQEASAVFSAAPKDGPELPRLVLPRAARHKLAELMSDSTYRKTPLPVRLDLNKRNTREQLSSGTEDKRGALQAGGVCPTTESQKDCNDVMRKHLEQWLVEHGISGPPPSPEVEQRAMWQWIRDFHKEYSDDWYARNMPRLRDQFRPIFVQHMKTMREHEAKANGYATGAGDLLDLNTATPTSPAPAPAPVATGSVDLLDM